MAVAERDGAVGQAVELVRAGRLAEAEAAVAGLAAEQRAAAALLRGAVAARRGDLARALSETGRAVQLALDEGEALTALAAVQLALGQPGFARLPAERATRRAADFPPGHAALAAAEQRALDSDAALLAIRRAAVAAAVLGDVRADTPGFRAIAGELAERLVQAGQAEEARKFEAAAGKA